MGLSIIESPNNFGMILNNEGYTISSDTDDITLQISIQVYIENSPGSDTYSFVFQNDIYPNNNGEVELFLKNLEAVLDSDKPDLTALSPKAAPSTSKKYKLLIGEKTSASNQVVSENYSESGVLQGLLIPVTLDEPLVEDTQYLVVVETTRSISNGDIKFGDGVATQNLNDPIVINDEVWLYAIATDNWSLITIPNATKVTVYKNPVIYIEQDPKYMINGGTNNEHI